MYGDVVLDMKPEHKEDHDPFEVILCRKKKKLGSAGRLRVSPASALKELVAEFKAAIKAKKGKDFPERSDGQLKGAILAVFNSWENARAMVYRRFNGIPRRWGTAVNVQSMVFGNLGDDSATGVGFTRDPATRRERLLRRIPDQRPGRRRRRRHPHAHRRSSSSQKDMPAAYKQLDDIRSKLEKHYRDMQDIEFTIQNGQALDAADAATASAPASPASASPSTWSREADHQGGGPPPARARRRSNQLLQPIFDPDAKTQAAKRPHLAKGINAGPGAATGKIVFFAEDAEAWARAAARRSSWFAARRRPKTCAA